MDSVAAVRSTIRLPRAQSPTPLVFACLFLVFLSLAHTPTLLAKVDFSFEIQPLLADRCYACHGPDEKGRKAKLRLDTREGALLPRPNSSKAVIIPGKPDESEFIQRIYTQDPDDLMPPPDSHLTLNDEEKNLLKRWILEGAEFGKHWSFESIRKVSPPPVRASHWVANPIDAFVLARLEKAGIAPAPIADPERLLRRVSLDLTGLPPSVAEMDLFLKNPTPAAYEAAVDRLLRSPTFGERFAADWMDVARYSDTHGYQMDRYRAVWPWRDWVIHAFNQNLPYDQFVTWQLAGDLLPNPTREQRLATAFNRLHLQNEEGGIVEEEFRVAYVVDRVNTLGTAFLGLTFECSRCHDHKYDPVSMRDFYGLFSMFQNIDESGQTVYFGDIMPVPTLLLPSPEQEKQLKELRDQIALRSTQQSAFQSQSTPSFERWLRERPQDAPAPPGLVASFSFNALADGKFANDVDPKKPGNAVESPALVDGREGRAVELNGDNGVTFPGVGHFTRSDPFTLSVAIHPPSGAPAPRWVVLHHSRAWMDAGSRGYEILLENGRISAGLHHMWPGNSLKIQTRNPLPPAAWTHVTVTYDGSSQASGLRIYLNGERAEVDVIRDKLWKDITYDGSEPDLALGYRFRDSGFKGGRIDNLRVFQRALTPIEVKDLAQPGALRALWSKNNPALGPTERTLLHEFYLATAYPPATQHAAELQRLRKEESRLIASIPDIMVMEEMPQPKPAYVLKRGAYDARAERVDAATPASLPPLHPNWPKNRLGLARWLTSPEHPLFARVTVNRYWQLLFGKGLVDSPDNFGTQGAMPSHPELLDWLAADFRDSGWDLKRWIKQVVLSSTYRQSSRLSPDAKTKDPENRLLSRAPVRRLAAEGIRDQALAASGLLVPTVGGPSVKPYQPDGLWEDKAMGAPRYDQGHGNDLYRRSLYTYWKRTVPHPALMVFDAADRNNCAVRRQSTSTPLQPLALLNDPQLVEAARFLAERMLKEGGATAESKVGYGFRLVTGRRPTARETPVLVRMLLEQRQHFTSSPTEAEKLLTVGEKPNDPSLPLADLAATTVVAQAILSHDEALQSR